MFQRILHKTTLLVDLGEVVIGWSMDPILEKLVPDSGKREEVKPLFKKWNPEWDKGTLRETMNRMAAAHPEYGTLCHDFFKNWIVGLGRVNKGTVDILRRVKDQEKRLLLASNWSADTFEVGRPHMPFLELFDGLHISGRIGKIKPGKDYFLHMMEEFKFRAEEALFVDDRQVNIDGARAVGIDGILFQNAAQLAHDLEKFGISGGASLILPSASQWYRPGTRWSP